jgi:hypothetical protein
MTTKTVDLWKYAIVHLKAVGPVTLGELRRWILAQVPGVTSDNVNESVRRWIREASDRDVVTTEHTEDGLIIDAGY